MVGVPWSLRTLEAGALAGCCLWWWLMVVVLGWWLAGAARPASAAGGRAGWWAGWDELTRRRRAAKQLAAWSGDRVDRRKHRGGVVRAWDVQVSPFVSFFPPSHLFSACLLLPGTGLSGRDFAAACGLVVLTHAQVCGVDGGCGRRSSARPGGEGGSGRRPDGPVGRPGLPEAGADGSDRFCGLRPPDWRRKAAPAAQDTGQGRGTAEVPLRPGAGRPGVHSRPAGRYRPHRRRRLAQRRQRGGAWRRFLRRRRRNWCAAIPQHCAGHGGCVCASVGA